MINRNQGGRWCEMRLERGRGQGLGPVFLGGPGDVPGFHSECSECFGKPLEGSRQESKRKLFFRKLAALWGIGWEQAVGGVEGRDERHPEECSTTESVTLQSILIPGRGK